MLAALEMMRDSVAHLGREIAFHVVGEFFPDVAAVDFYDLGWRRHKSSDHPMPQSVKGDKAVRTLGSTFRHRPGCSQLTARSSPLF